MSDEFFEIHCPECQSVLIVRRRDGKLLETRKPILKESTGDRFEDARLKVKGMKDEVERKVEEAKQREKTKMDRLNALFEDGLKKQREEGGPVKRPEREVDLD